MFTQTGALVFPAATTEKKKKKKIHNFHLSLLVRCLSIQAAVTIVTPHTVVFQNVQHPGHLAEDQNTGTLREIQNKLGSG